MDLSTLENRLLSVIKRLPRNNHSQQFSHINSSASIGTMIPTPGMPRSLNASLVGTSSVDSSVTAGSTLTSSAVNSGNFVRTTNFPSGSMHGVSFIYADDITFRHYFFPNNKIFTSLWFNRTHPFRPLGKWISAVYIQFLNQFWWEQPGTIHGWTKNNKPNDSHSWV